MQFFLPFLRFSKNFLFFSLGWLFYALLLNFCAIQIADSEIRSVGSINEIVSDREAKPIKFKEDLRS